MAEIEQSPNYGVYPCFLDDCQNSTSCTINCFDITNPLPLPPPPPPPPPPPSQTHFAPFLIAIVCILGISFLLLTTCTIILRVRFTRRRGGVSPANSPNNDDDDDGGFVDHPIWHITTVGLQQSVIDSITAFKFKKIDGFFVGGNDCSCSVCLTEFEDGDDLRLLPKCSHAFHVSCIDTWLRSHKNCPLCRAPIVTESFGGGGNSVFDSSNSGFGDEVLSSVNNSDDHGDGDGDDSDAGEGSSGGLSERREDVVGRLPVLEGIKIAEVLNKNRELRVFSDLGENHRFRGVENDGGLEPVRRSISFNDVAASLKYEGMMGNEGCSRGGNIGVVLQEKKNDDVEKESSKKGSSISGILMKSSSIGRSLQKGPVSMKRSLSSSSKFFSFRRSKSQANILPL